MDESEIASLWDKKIPKVTQAPTVVFPPVPPGNKGTTQEPPKLGEVDFTVLQDYSYKSARVVVVGGITTPVKHWWEIKKHVFNYGYKVDKWYVFKRKNVGDGHRKAM
jgi:hypothetical protein